MPIPLVVGRLNKAGLNRVTKRLAPWLPDFGIVVHRGRRSGRRFETPVNVFPHGDGYAFALTYGANADWVKNVLAAGGCEVRIRGKSIALAAPRLVHDESRGYVPAFPRRILEALGVTDFLLLERAPGGAPGGPTS